MMLMLMGDGDMSDMLPLMMMGGMGGAQGQAGAMNPMMMMLLLDDDSSSAKTKVACDKKYKLNHAFKWDGAKFVKTTGTAVRATVEHMKSSASSYPTAQTIINDYNTCLAAATSEGTASSSSSLKDLLPLMMMGGVNGGAGGMDPMMMMLMLKD